MKRNILVFGGVSSLIIAIMMSFSVFLHDKLQNDNLSMMVGYAGMIVAFSMIFAAIKNYRDKYNGGTISFGQAFKLGLIIALITSTVYVGIWMIEYQFFFPDFMEKYTASTLEHARASNMPADKYNKLAAQMAEAVENYKNPMYRILMTYAEILPIGLLASIACALILKRKNLPRQPQVATI